MYVFSVIGIIGSGKTSLIESLSNNSYLNNIFFISKEPVKIWQKVGALNLFYSNPKKYALEFQTHAIESRTLQYKYYCNKIEKYNQKTKESEPSYLPIVMGQVIKPPKILGLIMDGCPRTDFEVFTKVAYENEFMNKKMMDFYLSSIAYRVIYLPEFFNPHIYIVLDCDEQTCIERIKKRDRKEEIGISRKYLSQLKIKQEEMLQRLVKGEIEKNLYHVLKLLSNSDIEEIKDLLDDYQRYIKKYQIISLEKESIDDTSLKLLDLLNKNINVIIRVDSHRKKKDVHNDLIELFQKTF